jgi:hypothetical protein
MSEESHKAIRRMDPADKEVGEGKEGPVFLEDCRGGVHASDARPSGP